MYREGKMGTACAKLSKMKMGKIYVHSYNFYLKIFFKKKKIIRRHHYKKTAFAPFISK